MAVGNNIGQMYQYTLGGKKYNITPASQGGHMDAYATYAKNAEATRQREEQRLNKDLAQNNQTTNANFDNSARQAYVDYMRRQRALPGQLQALGVRGGATESGLLNLYNNYGVEHAANEQQRNAELASNARARDEAYNAYLSAWEQDLRDREQEAIANQRNEYNNEITRFSSSVAQYPATKEGYKNYEKWISNLAASNDPLKDIKIALVRQQMATQFPDGKPSGGNGGGGGGSRRRSYGGYRGGGGSSSSTTSEAEARAQTEADMRNRAAQYQTEDRAKYGTGTSAARKRNAANRVSRRFNWFTRG